MLRGWYTIKHGRVYSIYIFISNLHEYIGKNIALPLSVTLIFVGLIVILSAFVMHSVFKWIKKQKRK